MVYWAQFTPDKQTGLTAHKLFGTKNVVTPFPKIITTASPGKSESPWGTVLGMKISWRNCIYSGVYKKDRCSTSTAYYVVIGNEIILPISANEQDVRIFAGIRQSQCARLCSTNKVMTLTIYLDNAWSNATVFRLLKAGYFYRTLMGNIWNALQWIIFRSKRNVKFMEF